MTATEWVLTIAIVVLGVLVLVAYGLMIEILRQVGDLRSGAPPRQAAVISPDEGLSDGWEVTLAAIPTLDPAQALRLPGAHDTLLLFLSTTCGHCVELASGICLVDRIELGGADVYAIVDGSSDAVEAFARTHNIPRSWTVPDPEGATRRYFAIQTFPSVVVVDAGGKVAGHGVVNTVDQSMAFLARIRGRDSAARVQVN
jgi:hypothetical protein